MRTLFGARKVEDDMEHGGNTMPCTGLLTVVIRAVGGVLPLTSVSEFETVQWLAIV